MFILLMHNTYKVQMNSQRGICNFSLTSVSFVWNIYTLTVSSTYWFHLINKGFCLHRYIPIQMGVVARKSILNVKIHVKPNNTSSALLSAIGRCIVKGNRTKHQMTNRTSKIIYRGGKPKRACIADLMFCISGTQTMGNSRICHCLLFHKQNFVQPFRQSRKLLWLHTHLD